MERRTCKFLKLDLVGQEYSIRSEKEMVRLQTKL